MVVHESLPCTLPDKIDISLSLLDSFLTGATGMFYPGRTNTFPAERYHGHGV
jgi:hypothetical protein